PRADCRIFQRAALGKRDAGVGAIDRVALRGRSAPDVAILRLLARRPIIRAQPVEEHIAPPQPLLNRRAEGPDAQTAVGALDFRIELYDAEGVLVILRGQYEAIVLRLAGRVGDRVAVEIAARIRHLEVGRFVILDADIERQP